ncbi:SWPV1-137 [Shearwaterpox virus]|uniref:Protein OPG091 n=1 Tax=Shearwaterpox virus TaxID=1974596 RepID=A0A1V0QGW2_CNPV|nr:SWPV1-137 [Shearwaterpox virus]
MDNRLFDFIAPGALILSASHNSIMNLFNPSEEKHSSLYMGSGIIDFIFNNNIDFPVKGLNNFTRYIIEFNTSGMSVIPVDKFMLDREYVKLYYYTEGLFPNYDIMRNALIYAFTNVSKEYGFGKNKTYCFKMIADCYYHLGIEVKPYKILGKYIYLSQSFSEDNRWFKVVDTLTGENLITGNCYYLIR